MLFRLNYKRLPPLIARSGGLEFCLPFRRRIRRFRHDDADSARPRLFTALIRRAPIPFVSALLLVLAASPSRAGEWRFCVGFAPATHEAVITDVFDTSAESAQIEHRLEGYFRARRGKTLVFQCAQGAPERVAALNAQTQALQFDRVMGYSVSGFAAAEVVALAGGALF
jgi:hypothetical protein